MLLTSEEILDKIRKAFAPYHVVAELQDYHRQLGFRVYDSDNEIIDTFEGNLVQDLKNPAKPEADDSRRARGGRAPAEGAEALVLRGVDGAARRRPPLKPAQAATSALDSPSVRCRRSSLPRYAAMARMP